jgi:uncharacterized protein with ParB-like and HNH nuclease domain
MAIARDLMKWTTDGGMMQITPETKKVSELLPVIGDNAYAIPIYQRGYSWRNEQIDQLFEDIKEEEQGYYVGSLLVSGIDKEQRDEIVDGQQRIVTLSLFLLALWEACENFMDVADMHITPNPASVKADIQRQLLLPDGKPRIKLQEDDQRIYESLLSVTTGQSAGRWGNRAFAKRYKHIKSLLGGETFSAFQELTSFYGKINNVEILRITVPDLSDAFSVFSSLNSKGLPLTLIDLLKNEYLRTAITEGESNEKALNKWEKLLRELGKTYETDIDEWTVSQFLLNNFDAFSGETSPTTKGKALSEYKALFSEIGGEYINQLTANAKVFAQIIRLSDYDEFDSVVTESLDDLNRLESSQAYPLMLFLLARLDYLEIENQLLQILEFLIVFFVRRNIVLVPKASSVRSRMLQIIKKINDNELKGDELISCVFSELISISASDAQLDLALFSRKRVDTPMNTFPPATFCASQGRFHKGHPLKAVLKCGAPHRRRGDLPANGAEKFPYG